MCAAVYQEVSSRLHATVDATASAVARMDKLNMRQNRQDEVLAKLDVGVTALRGDMESIHKVNGGSFGGTIEALEARMGQFESSVTDFSRSLNEHVRESSRQTSALHAEMESRLEEAEKKRVDGLSVERLAIVEGKVAHIDADTTEAKRLSQAAFEQSIAVHAVVLKDVSAEPSHGYDGGAKKIAAGSHVELRYPMEQKDGITFMRSIGLENTGTVTSHHVPVDRMGVPQVKFAEAGSWVPLGGELRVNNAQLP